MVPNNSGRIYCLRASPFTHLLQMLVCAILRQSSDVEVGGTEGVRVLGRRGTGVSVRLAIHLRTSLTIDKLLHKVHVPPLTHSLTAI